MELGVISCMNCFLCASGRDVAWGLGLLRIPSLLSLTHQGKVEENSIRSQTVPHKTQSAIPHQAKFYQSCLQDQAFLKA